MNSEEGKSVKEKKAGGGHYKPGKTVESNLGGSFPSIPLCPFWGEKEVYQKSKTELINTFLQKKNSENENL